MRITNYGELKNVVSQYLDRDDASAILNISTFIGFAEQDLNQLLEMPREEVLTSLSVASDGANIAIPRDLKTLKTIYVNGTAYTRVSKEQFPKLKNQLATPWGTYQNRYYFTKLGPIYTFNPALKAGDIVSMVYEKHTTEMNADSDTIPELPECGELLVYLALRHAAVFFKDVEQEQYWTQKAQEITQRLNEQYRRQNEEGSIGKINNF